MSEPKRYFQLIHEGEDGTKTYRISGAVRRCAITGQYITNGERCNHDTQTLNTPHTQSRSHTG